MVQRDNVIDLFESRPASGQSRSRSIELSQLLEDIAYECAGILKAEQSADLISVARELKKSRKQVRV